MDIMYMDLKSFKDSRETGRWEKPAESTNRWETYGDEEVVDFDDPHKG